MSSTSGAQTSELVAGIISECRIRFRGPKGRDMTSRGEHIGKPKTLKLQTSFKISFCLPSYAFVIVCSKIRSPGCENTKKPPGGGLFPGVGISSVLAFSWNLVFVQRSLRSWIGFHWKWTDAGLRRLNKITVCRGIRFSWQESTCFRVRRENMFKNTYLRKLFVKLILLYFSLCKGSNPMIGFKNDQIKHICFAFLE